MMRMRVWRASLASVLSTSFESSGSVNAAVFPVPVCAMPMTSAPLATFGMALSWMGVGVSYPVSWTALRMRLWSGS